MLLILWEFPLEERYSCKTISLGGFRSGDSLHPTINWAPNQHKVFVIVPPSSWHAQDCSSLLFHIELIWESNCRCSSPHVTSIDNTSIFRNPLKTFSRSRSLLVNPSRIAGQACLNDTVEIVVLSDLYKNQHFLKDCFKDSISISKRSRLTLNPICIAIYDISYPHSAIPTFLPTWRRQRLNYPQLNVLNFLKDFIQPFQDYLKVNTNHEASMQSLPFPIRPEDDLFLLRFETGPQVYGSACVFINTTVRWFYNKTSNIIISFQIDWRLYSDAFHHNSLKSISVTSIPIICRTDMSQEDNVSNRKRMTQGILSDRSIFCMYRIMLYEDAFNRRSMFF